MGTTGFTGLQAQRATTGLLQGPEVTTWTTGLWVWGLWGLVGLQGYWFRGTN